MGRANKNTTTHINKEHFGATSSGEMLRNKPKQVILVKVSFASIITASREGLAVLQTANPWNILDVLFLSEVVYCAKAAISYGLNARL